MATFKTHKVVAALPNPLEPNAIYAVRAGAGFDLYISDMTGTHAHPINTSQKDIVRQETYVQSRGIGIVTNGSSQFRDNTNFSQFSFVAEEGPIGSYGCFSNTIRNAVATIDETLPINPRTRYKWVFDARQKNPVSDPKAYAFIQCVDSDGMPIDPITLSRVNFKIDRAWNAATPVLRIAEEHRQLFDTFYQIYKSRFASVRINSYEYTTAAGFKIKPGTYSRIQYTHNFAFNTITYNASTGLLTGFTPFRDAAAGTMLSFAMADSVYLYPFNTANTAWTANRNMNNTTIPEEWTHYSLEFSLLEIIPALRLQHGQLPITQYPNIGQSMASATVGCKFGWLLNRSTRGGNETLIGGVNISLA